MEKGELLWVLSSHFMFLKRVVSIALSLLQLAEAIQGNKTLYIVTVQSKWLPPLNLYKNPGLTEIAQVFHRYHWKRTDTFVLLIKHSEKLFLSVFLYDKDLIICYLYIFIDKNTNIMHCIQINFWSIVNYNEFSSNMKYTEKSFVTI